MNPASELLRSKEHELVERLTTRLRETAFDNRYFLSPKRFPGLGTELASLFMALFEGDPAANPVARGQSLAGEGVGEKTILALVSVFKAFAREHLGVRSVELSDALGACDSSTDLVVHGFMKGREELLLKDQEQLRRALSAALESQSQELLVKNHAIDTSINGIILADLDGTVKWVNSSFLSLWGLASVHEVVGRNVTEFWSGQDARRILADLPRTGGWRGEFEAGRQDGDSFSVEVSASLIRNEEGRTLGIMTSFMDITERKRLQAQVLQAQKMDALGQLAGGITHDFNNLLTAVSGYLQLLLIDAPHDTQMHQDLMQIKAAVDRGTGLTRQLRLFTRQASGNRQSVSLNEVARETWEIFKRTFPPEITVQLDLAPALWTIEADPNQISQVLVNLCVNARDAMTDTNSESAGGMLTIETANVETTEERIGRYVTAQPGRYVLLRIRDTGIGMAPELLDRLFIPFVTTKSARSGTGLGLAVVYGIVTSHHGFIDVQSSVGKGAVFEILFPRAAQQKAPGQEETAVPPLARGHGRILVVDDEQQVREIMSRVLESCGYEVIGAEDGRDALTRFADGAGIDLVILDMMMPGMGGRECLAHLREKSPGVRVLITTGYTSDGSAQELLHEGALGIVEKPLDLKGFAEKVQKIVGSDTGCC
jgi:two-component system, cell cycle sensor histidine kinase and response regulator CckA